MNSLNEDIKGKYVVLNRAHPLQRIIWRVALCKDGSGCYAGTMGSAIVGTLVVLGEEASWRGTQVERLATQKEINSAKERSVEYF